LLPEGWECGEDDDGDIYFVTPDGVSQWEPPEGIVDPSAEEEYELEDAEYDEDDESATSNDDSPVEAAEATPDSTDAPATAGSSEGRSGRKITSGRKAKEFAQAA